MKRKLTLFGMALLACCSFWSCAEDDSGTYTYSDELEGMEITLISPVNGTRDLADSPSFEWSVKGAPSGVVYDILIGANKYFLDPIAEDITAKTYTMTDKLPMGGVYYWQVAAHLGEETIKSKAQLFTVSDFNAPVSTLPGDGVDILDQITFEWIESDVEDGVEVTYTVMAALEGTSADEAFEVGSVVNAGQLQAEDMSLFEGGNNYYWFVKATYAENVAVSQTRRFFKLIEDFPTVPELTYPSDNTALSVGANSVTLTWTTAVDPEGDDVTYALYVNDALVEDALTDTYYKYTVSTTEEIAYTWYVVASDDNGHDSTSEKLTFSTKVPVASGLDLAPLSEEGVYGLKEPLFWASCGEGFTYTVSLTSGSGYTDIAKGLTATTFVIPNDNLSCDLSAVKTFTVKVVGSKSGEEDVVYNTLSFKPQMQGTFVDERAGNIQAYKWVRVGKQIWMAENLAAECLTDGTPMDCTEAGENIADADFNNGMHYEVIPDSWNMSSGVSYFPLIDRDTYTAKMLKENLNGGYVYSRSTAKNAKLAPAGWHVLTLQDAGEFVLYIGFKSIPYKNEVYGPSLTTFKSEFVSLNNEANAATDKYGLGFAPGPLCQNTGGWRTAGLWDSQAHFTLIDTGSADEYRMSIGLKAGNPTVSGGADGAQYFEFRPWANVSFPVRCIMND